MPLPALIADIDSARTCRGYPTAVLDAVRGMYFLGAKVIFISGRAQRERADIVRWLEKHAGFAWEGLYMRTEDDRRPERDVKAQMYEQLIRPHYTIRFVIDEGFDNADMWRELGLTVLHVHQDR